MRRRMTDMEHYQHYHHECSTCVKNRLDCGGDPTEGTGSCNVVFCVDYEKPHLSLSGRARQVGNRIGQEISLAWMFTREKLSPAKTFAQDRIIGPVRLWWRRFIRRFTWKRPATAIYGQQGMDGATKVDIAIARLQNFEPPEGYYLAFSGGKDSVVILALAKMAGVKFDAHYHHTTIDPPELVQFVKTFPEVIRDHPPKTMFQMIPFRGLPRRRSRWCCEELKERGGTGRIVVTGIRHAESARRARRKMVETCYTDTTKRFLNAIVDWSDTDVWEFITINDLAYCCLYDEGFTRIGCVLCPMVRDTGRQIKRWPKIVLALRHASDRLYARETKGTQRFASADAMWEWWLDRDASLPNKDQSMMMFD